MATEIERKHSYKLRPGYDSDESLIEFVSVVEDRRFVDDLCRVLQHGGFDVIRKCADFSDCWFACFTSPYGTLDISRDEWGGIFGHGRVVNEQSALRYADRLLQQSGLFERVEVDYAEYGKPLPEQAENSTELSGVGLPDYPPFYKLRLLWLHITSLLTAIFMVGIYWWRERK